MGIPIVYKYVEEKKYNKKVEKNLCFVCATRTAVNKIDKVIDIYIKVASTPYDTCDECGEYISDMLQI